MIKINRISVMLFCFKTQIKSEHGTIVFIKFEQMMDTTTPDELLAASIEHSLPWDLAAPLAGMHTSDLQMCQHVPHSTTQRSPKPAIATSPSRIETGKEIIVDSHDGILHSTQNAQPTRPITTADTMDESLNVDGGNPDTKVNILEDSTPWGAAIRMVTLGGGGQG